MSSPAQRALATLLSFVLSLAIWHPSLARAASSEEEAARLAESEDDEELEGFIESLTYLQHPGLPPAASKIFFAKRPWTVSGFGEVAYTSYLGDKNRASGDIELYNTNLYRAVLYGAYRPVDWLVLYAEVFAEAFHDGVREFDFEAFPEVFVDFAISRPFGLRVGWAQVPIGYINNNDEPIMFHSVNRPDVERLIIPSQWIELGVQAYGRIGNDFTWMLVGFQGVDGEDLVGASWIRQGRHVRFKFRSPAVGAQIRYHPREDLELSLSGVGMESGNRQRLEQDGESKLIRAPTGLISGHWRYELGNWSFTALGATGWMGDTESIYELTRGSDHGPQIVGARTFGYYLEVGLDILPYLRTSLPKPHRTFFFHSDEMKLPLFARYERLDTHAELSPALRERVAAGDELFRSNLDILTVGMNFNPRRNVVIKSNFQLRHNRAQTPHLPQEGHRFETGIGFIF